MITFEKGNALCTLCDPAGVNEHGPRDVVRVVPGGEAAIVADDVCICLRCAQTLFETFKDGRTRYVHDTDRALFGITGTLYKPKGKRP